MDIFVHVCDLYRTPPQPKVSQMDVNKAVDTI